jgi:hypothetical protein
MFTELVEKVLRIGYCLTLGQGYLFMSGALIAPPDEHDTPGRST